MERATTVDEIRAAVGEARAAGRTVGLVPTMGALHAGHESLVRLARELADFVVVSVFVNPTQFGPGEDLDAYPRTLDDDCRRAESAGAHRVFAPSVREMYPDGYATRIHVEELSDPLCGRSRPGHFDGVAVVVTKLLNVVRPDVSVFGQKDAQQAVVIRRLARDLYLPGRIVIGPTVREADGLAMSSRNRYLNDDERRAALSISQGLFAAQAAWIDGERGGSRLTSMARERMDAEPLVEAEYAELRRLEDLAPWDGGGAGLLAVAARVGRTRLIDNVILETADEGAGLVTVPGTGRRRG